MMNHEELSTDLSSLASSSSSSPVHIRHPYTVQSPSTQSQDCDKSSVQSNTLGPIYTVQSPSSDGDKSSASPSRVSSTFSSSASRVSGTRRNWQWNRHDKGWNQCYVIMEEEEDEGEEGERESDRWQCFLVWALLAFGLVCLVVWGVATPYRPRVTVESLAVNNFYFGEGSDYTGVPTKLLTVNCTLRISIQNTASIFGIHISSTPVDLSYLDITVATGQMRSYYQPRKSLRILSLNLKGNRVPLYGAGSSLALAFRKGEIPLRVGFDIRSHINVVGRVIKTKHLKHISCSANISPINDGVIKFKDNSCK